MKRSLFLVCLLATFFCFSEQLDDLPEEAYQFSTNRIFLLTQPKSGSHWTMYILQHFSQRPLSNWEYLIRYFELPFSFQKPFIHFAHHYTLFTDEQQHFKHFFAPMNPKEDKFIMIVRNPKECFLRNEEATIEQIVKRIEKKKKITLFDDLQFLEAKIPPERRYVFYYEDLLENPREEIARLLAFLNIPQEGLDDFMNNLEYHKKNCLATYDKYYGSITKGKHTVYHSEGYAEEDLKLLDRAMKKSYPFLWGKYLRRYESN